jgi:hypothetical protein
MPDPYASIVQADEALQARLADVLELRATDPQQRAMINAYLSELELPDDAIALEVGCGTGAVTRILATMRCIEKWLGSTRHPCLSSGHALSVEDFPSYRSRSETLALWRSPRPRST